MKEEIYYVQETIGGWRQNAVFQGTYNECEKYIAEWCHNGCFNIVSEDDYEVDYID